MSAAWILCVLLIQTASGIAPQSPGTAELTRLEDVWNEAHRRGDADALDRLWADDFVAAVPGMRAFTRAEALDMVRSARIRFERYETSDLHVRLYGEAAVVTGRLRRTRTTTAGTTDDSWLFTKVYVRLEGRWKVVAFHASNAPQ